jgi:hypothetical protein
VVIQVPVQAPPQGPPATNSMPASAPSGAAATSAPSRQRWGRPISLKPVGGGPSGGGSTNLPFGPAFFASFEPPPPVHSGGREVSVHAINAEGGGSLSFNLPIANHLSKNIKSPMFTGRKEDWPEWKRKFEEFVRHVSSSQKATDSEMVQLLGGCMTESIKTEIALWVRQNRGPMSFQQIFTKLYVKFGRAQAENLRKKWLDVQIGKNSGKLTWHEMDTFRVNFMSAMIDVEDATPEESRRVLLGKIPEGMRKWVVEAETQRSKENPMAEIEIIGAGEEDVEASIYDWVGEIPRRVAHKGGGWFTVTLPSQELAKKLAEFHGREYGDEGHKLQVRLLDNRFGIEDIFAEILTKIEMDETLAEIQKHSGAYIRKATAESHYDSPFKDKKKRGKTCGIGNINPRSI